jgi:hypothetical protein
MAAAIRKPAMVLAVPALLGTFAGTASAAPNQIDCPAGYACFYTGPNFTGQKCQWTSADPQHADDCSWAGDTVVRSVWNNGTSSAYVGVCFYRLPNYDTSGQVSFLPQGHRENLGAGWKVLSHKWVRTYNDCPTG